MINNPQARENHPYGSGGSPFVSVTKNPTMAMKFATKYLDDPTDNGSSGYILRITTTRKYYTSPTSFGHEQEALAPILIGGIFDTLEINPQQGVIPPGWN